MQRFLLVFVLFLSYLSGASGFTMHPEGFPEVYVAVQDTLPRDTSIVSDSVKKIIVYDTLTVLSVQPVSKESFFLPNHQILFSDYRSTSDLLRFFPYTSVRSLGFVGLPDEVQFYGYGFGEVSWLNDGLLRNDRVTNAYNQNLIMTESIDSIEVVPLPRGFLPGVNNNPAAINIISKDIISSFPISRVRYYEGAFSEAFVDAQVSTMPFKSLALTIGINNKKTDEGYVNSAQSYWLGTAKLRWMAAGKLNFLAEYSFMQSEVGLNGGVLVDSIPPQLLDEILYSEINSREYIAFPNRYVKNRRNQISVGMLYEPWRASSLRATVYYHTSLDEFRNDALDSTRDARNRSYQMIGGQFEGNFILGNFLASLNAGAERNSVSGLFANDYNDTRAFTSFSLSTQSLFGAFTPSVFAKALIHEGTILTGFGADVSLMLDAESKVYAGLSRFKREDDIYEGRTYNYTTAEVTLSHSAESLSGSLSGFYTESALSDAGMTPPVLHAGWIPVRMSLNNSFGAGLHLLYRKGFFLGEFTGSLMWHKDKVSQTTIEPTSVYQVRGGVYYRDVLFDSALVLKTGFAVNAGGRQDAFIYNFYYSRVSSGHPSIQRIPDYVTVDFTLAGEIQQSAILYFTWENLTNRQYFITPYYPMPLRAIRFGIAWTLFN